MPQARAARPGLVLAMLLLVSTFGYLDRQVIGILAQPIKLDLHLTDTQLGALGGLAFALLYVVLGIPLAALADRTSRSWVITVSFALWSGFSALCGFATGFWQLFSLRLGVGVGEAGGTAPSYALIADYFPESRLARAIAIYGLGIPIGLASGALLGGYIAQVVRWQTAFIVAGIAGLLIAPVFKLIVRDLPRPAIRPAQVPVSTVLKLLARKPSFWLMSVGAGLSSMIGYGLGFWVPSVLIRSFHFNLIDVGQFGGSLILIGGTIGVLGGGWLASRLGGRDRGIYAKLPAIAWVATAPFYAAALLTSSPTWSWLWFLPPNALNILWFAPVTTAVQHLVPPPMRATASAAFLLINNVIGLGFGTIVLGAMSDAATHRFGTESLRFSAVAILLFYFVAAALMLIAVKHLRRDWVDDDAHTAPLPT